MGGVIGIWLVVILGGLWFNKRFWDRLKKTPHNRIRGLDDTQ